MTAPTSHKERLGGECCGQGDAIPVHGQGYKLNLDLNQKESTINWMHLLNLGQDPNIVVFLKFKLSQKFIGVFPALVTEHSV